MDYPENASQRPTKKTRDRVILSLQNAYAHDLIEEHEFEKRLDEATNTNNHTALMELIKDVPLISEEETDHNYSINRERVNESATVLTLLSATERKGVWRPPKRLTVFNFMGGTELDFTSALMAPGTTQISITCIMGGIEITIPEGINVEVHGVPIMGGIENRATGTYDRNAPTLKIKAFVLMGGLEIKPTAASRKIN